jgi:hypothetical protein
LVLGQLVPLIRTGDTPLLAQKQISVAVLHRIAVWVQDSVPPESTLHVSVVVGLPSSQTPVCTQPVGPQLSVVQGLPSSQSASSTVWTHPAVGSQVSTVHGLPSSQKSMGLRSMCWQPTVGSVQKSSVQMFPSSQVTGE